MSFIVKRASFVFVLAAILLISFMKPAMANTQPVATNPLLQSSDLAEMKCWPLDVAFLVDQSYSMLGGSGSDPENYRFAAAREIFDRLILNRQEQCPLAIHRFALITFGSNAIVHLNLVQVDLNENDNSDTWGAAYFKEIENAKLDTGERYTDFKVAFERAQSIFDSAPQVTDPTEYGPRRRVVILLTDGNPTNTQIYGGADTPHYMCQLQQYLDSSTWQTSSLWVVALNAGQPYLDNPGCSTSIRQDWLEITGKHNGKLFALPYNEQTIPAFVSDIVDAEFGQPGEKIVCNQTFYVDPYLQQIEFRFYRRMEDKNLRMTITKLDNNTLQPIYQIENGVETMPLSSTMTLRQGSYKLTDLREDYIFDNPLAGPWRFTVKGLSDEDCQRSVEARKIGVTAQVKVPQSGVTLPQVSDSPYYDSSQPYDFTVKLQNDTTGAPVANDPDFPLQVTVKWEPPSGKDTLPDGTKIGPIELYPSDSGEWTNKEMPVLTPELGTYTIQVEGIAPKGDKQSQFEVFSLTKTFAVKNISRFGFNVVEPTPNSSTSCNSFNGDGVELNNAVKVSVQLTKQDGTPASADQYILSNLDQSFQADLYDSSGKLIETQTLNHAANGVFNGELLQDQAMPSGCGNVSLRVHFTGSFDPDHYGIPVTEIDVPLTRVQSVGVVPNVITPVKGESFQRFANIYAACSPKNVVPIAITINLQDLRGNKLNPADILAAPDSSLGYGAIITGPNAEQEKVQLTLDKNRQLLMGEAGLQINEIGAYQLKLAPLPAAFKPGYVPIDIQTPIGFERKDGALLTPTACGVATGFTSFIGLILFGLIFFGVTGGPGGRIELYERGNYLWGSNLSSMRLMTLFPLKSSALKEKGIEALQYKKGTAAQPGGRAVHLTAFNKQGEPILANDVDTSIHVPITTDIEVRYSHPKDKSGGTDII